MNVTQDDQGEIKAKPAQVYNYDEAKEEIISNVWDFSIAKAQDYAPTPELKKSIQDLVYSISESILHNDKINKMYHDSNVTGKRL